jgi:hypothetical protein
MRKAPSKPRSPAAPPPPGTKPAAAEPFAITLRKTGQDALRPVVRWLASNERFRDVVWTVEELVSTCEEPVPGTTCRSPALLQLMNGDVLELQIDGHHRGALAWRLVFRDAVTIDLLGHGEPPTPFEVGSLFDGERPSLLFWPY